MKNVFLISLICYSLASFGQDLSTEELTSIIQEKDHLIFDKAKV